LSESQEVLFPIKTVNVNYSPNPGPGAYEQGLFSPLWTQGWTVPGMIPGE